MDDKDEKPINGIETQTSKDEDEPKTRWEKICRKFRINPNLVMLKLTLFFMYGATSSLLPYLTIHMQSIGITVEEIAIIYLALPFTTFLAPPITGFLVDKFGKYKPVMILTLVLNAVFHHALILIPQQEIPGTVPDAYIMRHPGRSYIEVWWSPCPSRPCPDEELLSITVEDCVDHCILHDLHNTDDVATTSMRTVTAIKNEIINSNMNFKVSQKSAAVKDAKNLEPLIPSTTISTTLSTSERPEEAEEEEEESWVAGSGEAIEFVLDMHPDLGEPTEQLGMDVEEDNKNHTDFITRFGEKLLTENGVNVTELDENDLRCGGLVMRHNITISEEKLKELSEDCMVQKCKFLTGGPEKCPPDYRDSDDNVFWIYFLLRFLGTIMLSGGVTMMDPISLTMVEKYNGDFGRERLFSMFGMAIFSPITGILIDYYSRKIGFTDYQPAFYTYDILLLISAYTVYKMPLGDKIPADNVFRDLWNLLKMPHVICFITFLFLLGNFWGFIESFLFLYLKELGAPNYLLGFTLTVGTVSSVPFLYTAEKITKIFGHVNLIVIAFFSHACRLVGYSFIEDPWWCFPFEAMEALSCHLMWVAAATYCSVLAQKHLLATLIGVLGMAHFSLGRGSGSFVGGFLIGEYGTRDAFRYMGLVAVAGGFAYKITHVIWLKKYDQIDDDPDILETGEGEKLQGEPKMKDMGTSMSQEHLPIILKYGQMGSLTSLSRSKADLESLIRRRSSYTISSSAKGGSASKVDLLKSALEISNNRHQIMSKRGDKNSDQSLRSFHDSAPRLSQHGSQKISQLSFIEVLDENKEFDESTTRLTKQKKRHHQSGLLYNLNKASGEVELDVVRNYLRVTEDAEKRDSIPEEDLRKQLAEAQAELAAEKMKTIREGEKID